MKTLIKNRKLRKALSITGHVIGTISFLFVVYAVLSTWIDPQTPIVSPAQATSQMDSDPSRLPNNVVVKSRIKEIKRVPLYGYSYRVADNMYIINFSRGTLKPGDTVRFKITGAVKIGDSYLVNADYE